MRFLRLSRFVLLFVVSAAVGSLAQANGECSYDPKDVPGMGYSELMHLVSAECIGQTSQQEIFKNARVTSGANPPYPESVLYVARIVAGIKREQALELSSAGKYKEAQKAFVELEQYARQTQNIVGELGEVLPGGLDSLPATGAILSNDAAKAFWGNWGTALLMNFKDNPSIESATVSAGGSNLLGESTPGIISVDRANDIKMGLGLEAHRFVWGTTFGGDTSSGFNFSLAAGPYISIMPGEGEIVDVLGAGLLVGLLGDPRWEKKPRASLNFGVGYFWDFKSLQLKEGFVEGASLPEGFTTVQLKEETDEGLQIMVSFSLFFGDD